MTRDSLLAYVFWHWRQASAERGAYESAQQAFQRVLTASPSAGFVRSFSHAVMGAPWANQGGEAYEDWYLVRDAASLDPLEEAAVTAGRKAPHDAAASLAAAGTAGLYHLKLGGLPAARAVRVADQLLVELDAEDGLVGCWLLGVPPFPSLDD